MCYCTLYLLIVEGKLPSSPSANCTRVAVPRCRVRIPSEVHTKFSGNTFRALLLSFLHLVTFFLYLISFLIPFFALHAIRPSFISLLPFSLPSLSSLSFALFRRQQVAFRAGYTPNLTPGDVTTKRSNTSQL